MRKCFQVKCHKVDHLTLLICAHENDFDVTYQLSNQLNSSITSQFCDMTKMKFTRL